MSIISDEQTEVLRINRFIFHVVQHGKNEPILLDETPLGEFESFFLERVKDTLKGNKFEFNPGSATYKLLNEIAENSDNFIPNSKQLAINFHSSQDKRIKPGVLIIMQLITGSREYYSLIKYEHEQVLTYNLEGNTRAILEEIANSFTKSKNALHKSALISLNNEGGELIVIDKTVQYDITDFFRGFLNVRRKYNEKEMTEIVQDAIIKTVQQHRDDLPREITSKIRTISYQAIQILDVFDSEQFFNKVFGIHGSEDIRNTFYTYLKKKDIEGESFRFDKNAVDFPKEKKYRTHEGVRLRYGVEAEHTVDINYGTGEKPTIITIKTSKLTEE